MKSTFLSLGLIVATTSGVASAQTPVPAAPSGPPPAAVELAEEPEPASPSVAAPPPAAATSPAVQPNAAPRVAPPAPPFTGGTPSAPPWAVAPPPAIQPAPTGPPVADARPEKPRGPIKSRFNVGINIDNVWYTGKSFDFFSDQNNVTTPGVSIGYAVVFDAPLSIVPEIGWSTSKASASNVYGYSHTELTTQTGYAGLSLRFGILSFLETHARVAGGMSHLDATVQTTGATGQQEDTGWSPFGSLGAGFTVHTPAGSLETQSGALRSVLAGITVEGGYVMGGSVDLTPTPTGDSGRIATTYLPIGTLERSGPYIRTALSVRF